MKRKHFFLTPLLLFGLTLSGCSFSDFLAKIGIYIEDDSQDSGSVIVDKFYKDYNLKKTGGRLIQELQKLCFDKHTKWVTYEQTKSYYSKTSDRNSCDAISDGASKNEFFYTGKENSGYGTREHVWPCANSAALWTHDEPESGFSPHYVDNKNYVGGGSDLFHVRPSTSSINTARGNSRFCDFDDPEYAEYKGDGGIVSLTESGGKYPLKIYGADQTSSGGYQYASRSEPADEMKGDVARIVLYVYVHYQERGDTPDGYITSGGNKFYYTDMTGSLSLSAIMGYDSEDRCKEVLMAWNKLDTPSEVEKLRNNTVQKIQGNRNPFVDYPELVDQMFE